MTRQLISSGSTFEAQVGYSRAVVVGNLVFVSGCTGYDYAAMTISENVLEQAEQTFRNIETALAAAGASLNDVVRVTYILPNRADFEPCHPIFRKYFGDIRPACTVYHAQLTSDAIKIEIEVTAVKEGG
jgi:enamine deaminase RidA (YjgF/YER057c/UK114 family)